MIAQLAATLAPEVRDPDSWDLLTQLVVPGVGALASITVAIIAIVVTIKLARLEQRAAAERSAREQEERERDRRREARLERAQFVEAVEQFIFPWTMTTEEDNHPRFDDAEARLRASAALAPEATPLVDAVIKQASWLRAEKSAHVAMRKEKSPARSDMDLAQAAVKVVARVERLRDFLHHWVRTGDADCAALPQWDEHWYKRGANDYVTVRAGGLVTSS